MNALKKLRVSQNLSIDDLSEKSGVAPNTISGLERSLQNAIPRTVARLAEALGVQYEELAVLETQVVGKEKKVA